MTKKDRNKNRTVIYQYFVLTLKTKLLLLLKLIKCQFESAKLPVILA